MIFRQLKILLVIAEALHMLKDSFVVINFKLICNLSFNIEHVALEAHIHTYHFHGLANTLSLSPLTTAFHI